MLFSLAAFGILSDTPLKKDFPQGMERNMKHAWDPEEFLEYLWSDSIY